MTKIQFDSVTKISVGNPIYNMQGYQRDIILELANGETFSLTLYGKTIKDLSIVNQSPHEALADLLDRYGQLEATIAELRARQSQAQPMGSTVTCLGCGKAPHLCMCSVSTCQNPTQSKELVDGPEIEPAPLSPGCWWQESDKILVSDPCYKVDEEHLDHQALITNVATGIWESSITYHDGVVASIMARLFAAEIRDYDSDGNTNRIGVDSGQAGIFDYSKYPHGSRDSDPVARDFYDRFCESNYTVATLPEGIGTSSGYGDGRYPVRVWRNKEGKAEQIQIIFIKDDEDEEDNF